MLLFFLSHTTSITAVYFSSNTIIASDDNTIYERMTHFFIRQFMEWLLSPRLHKGNFVMDARISWGRKLNISWAWKGERMRERPTSLGILSLSLVYSRSLNSFNCHFMKSDYLVEAVYQLPQSIIQILPVPSECADTQKWKEGVWRWTETTEGSYKV